MSAGRPRVLVVDDEPDIVLIMLLSLEHAGYQVEQARSGAEALRIIPDLEPDVMVLDVMLPDISGWQVLDQMQASGALERTRVVVCSAHTGPAGADRAADYGATFLSKPFLPDDLIDMVAAPSRA